MTREEFEKLVSDLVSECEWFANCIIERQYTDAHDALLTIDGLWESARAEFLRIRST